MRYLLLLNLTYVTYTPNLGDYGWRALEGMEGFEASSPFGEIRPFTTYRAANQWRHFMVREADNLIRYDETIHALGAA